MFRTLRAGLGFHVGMSLALFAALCFTVPPAVMASGHGENTLHCLSMTGTPDHGASHHEHGDGKHGAPTHAPADKAPGCCGLFCLSALLPASAPATAAAEPHAKLRPEPQPRFSELIADLLDRPPISLPSV